MTMAALVRKSFRGLFVRSVVTAQRQAAGRASVDSQPRRSAASAFRASRPKALSSIGHHPSTPGLEGATRRSCSCNISP